MDRDRSSRSTLRSLDSDAGFVKVLGGSRWGQVLQSDITMSGALSSWVFDSPSRSERKAIFWGDWRAGEQV